MKNEKGFTGIEIAAVAFMIAIFTYFVASDKKIPDPNPSSHWGQNK